MPLCSGAFEKQLATDLAIVRRFLPVPIQSRVRYSAAACQFWDEHAGLVRLETAAVYLAPAGEPENIRSAGIRRAHDAMQPATNSPSLAAVDECLHRP